MRFSDAALRTLVPPNQVNPGTSEAQDALLAIFANFRNHGQLFTNSAAELVEGLLVLAFDLVLFESEVLVVG
jgi:hypothetical protein